MSYYDNFNPSILELVDSTAQRICEFGCGGGALARAVKKIHPGVFYAGVELMEEPLSRAMDALDIGLRRNLDGLADWDTDHELASALPLESFDHVIFGDVLEHLYDPEQVLAQAVRRLKTGGSVLACIPNAQHWSIFAQLVSGHWPREDSGLFDRTHIRWFTLEDMATLMHGAGLRVLSITPRVFDREKGLEIMEYLEPLAAYLGIDDTVLVERGLALQYVLKAEKP